MDLLEKLYFDVSKGYVGANKLYKQAKAIDPSITMKQVKQFYNNHQQTQLFKRIPKPSNLPIVGNLGWFQVDLIFYEAYKRQNSNYIGAFIAVGIVNRYGYGYPIKSKSAEEINRVMNVFIADVDRHAQKLYAIETDSGTEFLNSKVQKTLQDHGIVHYPKETGQHTSLGKIDRFSRTIKQYISRYMVANNTARWVDVFPDLIKNYNSSYNTALGTTPNDLSDKKEKRILQDTVDDFLEKTALNTKYVKVGSFVRLPQIKQQFGKEGQTYTKPIYEVVDLSASKIWVKNTENGNELKRSYNVNQVQVVKRPKSVLEIPRTDNPEGALLIPRADSSIPIRIDHINAAKKQAAIERKLRREGIEANYSTEPRLTRSGNR